ncbi:MAG TPA: 2'-deoxycytidine 5'-triphosphate deaminase [Alphaproteobacteria bacterium]|nr:2'-deoxycytidine 5'-triphosphate deaminase [Alphaproteobacteria bacterium]
MYNMLVDHQIKELINRKIITSLNEDIIDLTQFVEPSSVDIPIGKVAYEIRDLFRPKRHDVNHYIEDLKSREFNIDKEFYLHKGFHYIVPTLKVSKNEEGDYIMKFSPKSSIGRVDMHVRSVADHFDLYDILPKKYSGNVYNILSPQSFNIRMKGGMALNQLRFTSHTSPQKDIENILEKCFEEKMTLEQTQQYVREYFNKKEYDSQTFLMDKKGNKIKTEIYDGYKFQMSLSLKDYDIIGYEALNTNEYVDITENKINKASTFYKPIEKTNKFKFEKGKNYIMVSKEKLSVPPKNAIEMTPSSHLIGELKIHKAGFFDNGFGYDKGNSAVLEITALEDVVIEDGATICWMEIHENNILPDLDYNKKTGGNYVNQEGPVLAKYFYNDFIGEKRK